MSHFELIEELELVDGTKVPVYEVHIDTPERSVKIENTVPALETTEPFYNNILTGPWNYTTEQRSKIERGLLL